MVENTAAKANTKGSPRQALTLAQLDRVLLDLLRDGIAERSEIRNARVGSRAQSPEDTKRARLKRNHERLETMFEEALGRPAINRALRDRGYDIVDLRDAADRGVWRDIVSAIGAIRPAAERLADEQRREAIADATRMLVTAQSDRHHEKGKIWIEHLEERVRASFAGEIRDDVAARRLLGWAEAAISVVPEPMAAGARIALAEHAFGGVLEDGGNDGRSPLRAALRVIMEEDKSGLYTRPSRDGESEAQGARAQEPNRIWFDDAAVRAHGERQVADFAEAARPVDAPAERGFLARLRTHFRGGKGDPAPAEGSADDDDRIPNSLKKRYAIHVSENGKTIELFEAGSKTPAITLDAQSISTPHNEGMVIVDMITLARDRGWQTLKVAGTADFKDALWLEASKAGLVAQHEPSSAVKAAFAKWERERPQNEIQQGPSARAMEPVGRGHDDLARAFAAKTPEERLADPRLRNAQMELTIGIRTAEKELDRPIAEMPDVLKALTAAVRDQLASGKVFDAPFVRPSPPKQAARQAAAPKVEPDRIPWPRPT